MQIEIRDVDRGSAGRAELPDDDLRRRAGADVMARVVHWRTPGAGPAPTR